MKLQPAMLAACSLAVSCAAEPGSSTTRDGVAETVMVPATWNAVTASCGFSFDAPPDYAKSDVQGIDSCVLSFRAGGCVYSADYGWYSGDVATLGAEPDYRRVARRIDRRDAEIVCYVAASDPGPPHFCGVHFPNVGPDPNVKLTVTAHCETAEASADAELLFQTIRFSP